MPRFSIPRLQTPSKPKFLNGIPNNSIFAIATLIAVNALVWIAAGIVLHFHPRLISPAALSYVLGLRHALDADHIAAIDLMTRQRPATVGTFFSLGHSTIVIVTCIVVAATSGALRERFDGFQHVGNIVGTSEMAGFCTNSFSAYKQFCKSGETKSDLKDSSRRRRRFRTTLLWREEAS
ncbi:hypothetical protein LB503_008796 [Fusarium chuoi]|nr:hypothetical protein LB503_008796 [Fusarium chuoi]